ncbi:MAG TPA: hypothetical protein EYQ31_06665 [Candidatus Handelsmanbacteria bacterium]|nr:hypothetical protein [Candidatus Handelsmanbacteria bacterium]
MATQLCLPGQRARTAQSRRTGRHPCRRSDTDDAGAFRPTSTPSSLPAAEELELAILEERAIRAVFEQSGGNQAETARLLGIGTDALRYRLRKHALR